MVKLTDVFEDASNLVPDNLNNNRRVIKVNIILASGNSEGIWAYIKDPKDIKKYDDGNENDRFDVILLNQPLAYSRFLQWGFVIKVKSKGRENRPILDSK